MKQLIVLIITLLLKFNVLEITEFKLDIDPVVPIYWISNEEIFVNENDRAYIYNVENREIVDKYEKEENKIYGYENNKIFICKTENKVRNSIEEYSTHLTKLDTNGEILLDIELKPTLEAIECRDRIILKTIFPIEEKFYVFEKDLYELSTYKQNLLSKNLKYTLFQDTLGQYKILEINLNLKTLIN